METPNPPPPVSPAVPALHPILDAAAPVECCAACRFWFRAKRENIKGVGAVAPCRRLPPTTALRTVMQQNPITKQVTAEQIPTNLSQPLVHGMDWCGEYQIESS